MPLQWRNEASLESYPFKPGLPRSSGTGEILDRDFIDFFVTATPPVWLRSLVIASDGITGEFETSTGEILTFEGGFDGGDYVLESSLGGDRGVVVLGDDDLFSKLPAGTHLFPDGLVEVLDTLVAPPPPGVSALSISGTNKAFGVVKIEAGDGITIEYSETEDDSEVRIHADGAVDDSGCGTGVAIRSINGVAPGETGGIILSESSFEVPGSDSESRQIFRVYPASNAITVQLVDPDA